MAPKSIGGAPAEGNGGQQEVIGLIAAAPWPDPEPGDIVWCRFPERPRDKPGPKLRPALVMEVTVRTDGTEVKVAYGTSRHLDHLRAGEFAIRKQDNPAAYALAGLSYDTKFNLAETLALPWTDEFFAVPAEPAHGQIPKLGTLHPGMMKIVAAAFRSARPSKLVKSRTR